MPPDPKQSVPKTTRSFFHSFAHSCVCSIVCSLTVVMSIFSIFINRDLFKNRICPFHNLKKRYSMVQMMQRNCILIVVFILLFIFLSKYSIKGLLLTFLNLIVGYWHKTLVAMDTDG